MRTCGRKPGSSITSSTAFAAAIASGQEPKKFELGFAKDKDNKYAPYHQQVKTEVTQVIKVQGQDLTQKQNSTFWYQWTPAKEEKGLKMVLDIQEKGKFEMTVTFGEKSEKVPGTYALEATS